MIAHDPSQGYISHTNSNCSQQFRSLLLLMILDEQERKKTGLLEEHVIHSMRDQDDMIKNRVFLYDHSLQNSFLVYRKTHQAQIFMFLHFHTQRILCFKLLVDYYWSKILRSFSSLFDNLLANRHHSQHALSLGILTFLFHTSKCQNDTKSKHNLGND